MSNPATGRVLGGKAGQIPQLVEDAGAVYSRQADRQLQRDVDKLVDRHPARRNDRVQPDAAEVLGDQRVEARPALYTTGGAR